MAKLNKVEEEQKQAQIYDTSMKELVDRQVKDILSVFLPGAVYKNTLNVEVVKPVLRTDKVYSVTYRGKKHVLHFHIIPLFLLRAEQFVREHVVCMYPPLAVMKGANRRLLKEAIEELTEVYRDDEETLGDFFAYMVVLLERSSTMTPLEKRKTKEVLSMYNNLWDQSPIIQKMRAVSRAEGEAEGWKKGKAEGELVLAQRMLINIVNVRFPKLTELAQQKVDQIQDAGMLELLVQQVVVASDENMARGLLDSTVV